MITNDTPSPGAPLWIDLFTSTPDESSAFYCALFGWEAQPGNPDFGGYLNFTKDGRKVAGMMTNHGDGIDAWSIYLAVADSTSFAADAIDHGATVIVPPMEVGPLGTMAVLIDVGGASIGSWEPGEHRGFEVSGEPGAPSWFELHTRDYEPSVSFYRDIFGWNTEIVSDTDDFRYTVMQDGDVQRAGIMDASGFLPPEQSAAWSIYFSSADTAADLARIVELGGSVVADAEPTPWGVLATAADPSGLHFRLQGLS